MKLADQSVIECIKQLLPNLAATGLWAGLAGLATGGAAVPLTVGLSCVLAHIGLQRRTMPESAEDHRRSAEVAFDVIRRRSAKSKRRLHGLGFDLAVNLGDMRRRLTALDTAIEGLGTALAGRLDHQDQALEQYFAQHRESFDQLCLFLQVNFNELQGHIAALPMTIDELRRAVVQGQTLLETIAGGVSRTEGKIDHLLELLEQDQRRLLAENERLQMRTAVLADENRSLREASRDAVRSIVEAAERGDAEAARAIAQYEVGRNPESITAFFDRFTRAADDVGNAASAEVVRRHRQRAALMYAIGDIARAVDSLNRILGLLPNDLDAIIQKGNIHHLRGEPDQAMACYQSAADLADDDSWHAIAVGNMGNVMRSRGELEGAVAMYHKTLEIFRRIGGQEGIANTYCNLGHVMLTRGDRNGAEGMYRKSLGIYQELGHLEGTANAFGNLGLVMKARGDLDGAVAMYRKALAIDQKHGAGEGMASTYGNLGNLLRTRGDLEGAEEMHRKALEIDQKLGRQAGIAAHYGNLGLVMKSRGDLHGAVAMFRTALEIYQRIGGQEGIASTYCNLGNVMLTRGDPDGAEEMYRKSPAIYQKLGHLEGMATAYGGIANVLRTRGDLDGAEEMYRKALEICQSLGLQEGMAVAYGNLGIVMEARGNVNEAENMYLKALELSQSGGDPVHIAAAHANLGNLLRARGDLEGAEGLYRRALRIYQKLGELEGMATNYANLGSLLERRGRREETRAMWTVSRDLYAKLGAQHMVQSIQSWIEWLDRKST